MGKGVGEGHGLALVAVGGAAFKAGGNHGDVDLALEFFVDHGAHNDVGIGIHHVVNHLGGGGHVLEGHVLAAADVDHAAFGAVDAGRFQQGATHGCLGGFAGPGAARAHANAQEGGAGIGHHRTHVGKVDVHQAWLGDDVADALHAHAQHVIGGAEGLVERSAGNRIAQAVVGDDDQGVHRFGQPGNALFGLAQALAAFKAEGLGDNAHGEGAHFLGHLGQDWGGPGAGAPTHARGDEHQVGALQGFDQFSAGFFRCFLTNHRVAARPQTPGELLAQLDALQGGGLDQGLGIGIEHPVAHPLQVGRDHAVDRIAAAPTHADHLNTGGLARGDAIGLGRAFHHGFWDAVDLRRNVL